MRDLQFSFGFSLLFLAAFEVKKVLIADEEFFFFFRLQLEEINK